MKRFIAILIFVAYITLGSLGFFFMADTNHQFHNFNCPFMPGEKSLCSMNIFEHVSSWVNMFTSFVPTIFFLFLSSILISYFYIFRFLKLPTSSFSFCKEKRFLFISRNQYSFAFSNGILNPKNP